MAEIGLAASVIAVIQITAAVTTQVYNYGQNVKNAKEDLESINRELEDLEKALHKLQDLAQRAEASGLPLERWPTLVSLNESDGPLKDCKIALTELKSQLTPGKGKMSWFAERLKWPHKKGKVEKSLQSILKQKDAFIKSLDLDLA
jgi:uncharacterized phage infection (PIP) family protein YhgE